MRATGISHEGSGRAARLRQQGELSLPVCHKRRPTETCVRRQHLPPDFVTLGAETGQPRGHPHSSGIVPLPPPTALISRWDPRPDEGPQQPLWSVQLAHSCHLVTV